MTKTSNKEESTTMENESRAHTTKVIIPLAVSIVGKDENSGFLRVERKDYPKSHESKKTKRNSNETTDVESNYDYDNDDSFGDPMRWNDGARYRQFAAQKEKEKQVRCLHVRISFGDLCKVVTLWTLIAGLALSISVMDKHKKSSNRSNTLKRTNSPTITDARMIDNERPSCSLCPAGTSVTNPDLEIITTEFQCTAISSALESMCFFECSEDSLPAHKVYTCGEVQQLAKESTSKCSDSVDSCREFQQASGQCCFNDS